MNCSSQTAQTYFILEGKSVCVCCFFLQDFVPKAFGILAKHFLEMFGQKMPKNEIYETRLDWQVLSWHEVEFLKADKVSCFWLLLYDTGQGIGVIVSQGGEDDHLVRGTVGDSQLVAEPAVETLLGVSQLLPPIDPVPGDLTQAPIDSKSKRDWKYP